MKNERTSHTFAVHLLLTCVCCALGMMLALGLVLFVPLVVQLELSGPDEVGRFARRVLELHASFWPVLTTTVFAVSVASFLLYRRMTGPLVRFTRIFASLREGWLPGPIQIRGGDYLSSQADDLNVMLGELRGHVEDLKRDHARLDEALTLLAERSADRPGVAELLADVQECSKQLGDTLGRFRNQD